MILKFIIRQVQLAQRIKQNINMRHNNLIKAQHIFIFLQKIMKAQSIQKDNTEAERKKSSLQDGFSSQEQPQQEILYSMPERPDDFMNVNNDQIKSKPQQSSSVRDVISKRYSLEPDMATGWAPKMPFAKPIPLTFVNYQFDEMIEKFFNSYKFKIVQNQQQKIRICYLGPRYQTTYYAWYDKQFQFPYQHLSAPKNIALTDRFFVGQHWDAEKNKSILRFDSLFECGNLDCVIKVGQNQYDLFIRVDSNTKGHLQWYNYKIKNMSPGISYKFNICNFQKGKNLYSRGMRPYCFSKKRYEIENVGWHQIDGQPKYRKKVSKSQKILQFDSEQKYFQLSFEYNTKYEEDELQFAYCIPYSYSKMKNYIKSLISNNESRKIISVKSLCTSLGGNSIDQLTITQNMQQEQKAYKNKVKLKKKVIFVTGRCHPGETNGSWMVEGFIDFLCGSTQMAYLLRENIIFKIVPMLNPDGVIIGNYRTGVFGKDFNRQFHSPDKDVFPEVYYLKEMFWSYKQIYNQSAFIYLDFHGHSVKKNVFAYGPEYPIIHKNYYESRMIPKLISSKSKMFRYHSCIFKISESKQSTGRAIFLKSHKIPFTYTIQASNGSYYDQQEMISYDFNQYRYKQVGQKVLQGIYDYFKLMIELQRIREKKLRQRKELIMKNREKVKIKKNQKVGYYTSIGFRKNKSINRQQDEIQNLGMGNVGLFLQDMLQNIKQIQGNNKISSLLEEIKKQQNPSFSNEFNEKIDKKAHSEDEISQGKSDSQTSKDDLDQNLKFELLAIIKKKKKRTKTKLQKISITNGNNPQKNPQNAESIKVQMEEQQKTEKSNMKKNSKQLLMKKYLWKKKSSVFSSLSPKKQEGPVVAKIVNFNFSLNPVECSMKHNITVNQNNNIQYNPNSFYNSTYYTSKSSSNCLSSKNQQKNIKMNENEQNKKFGVRSFQYSDAFKKTFMSVQKQILRRDSQKRYLVALNNYSQQTKIKQEGGCLMGNIQGRRIGHSVDQKSKSDRLSFREEAIQKQKTKYQIFPPTKKQIRIPRQRSSKDNKYLKKSPQKQLIVIENTPHFYGQQQYFTTNLHDLDHQYNKTFMITEGAYNKEENF